MARRHTPDAVIVDGKITNGDRLRAYWRDRHHLEYLQRRATFDFIRQSEQPRTIMDRIDDLETMCFEPGSIPRKYTEQVEQTRAQVLFLQKKVEALTLRKVKQEQSHY